MPYRIQERDGFSEIHVSGETSKWEVLKAIRQLRDRDPRKETSDLWVISNTSMVPFAEYSTIVEAVRSLCSSDMIGNKTAIVAADELQKAELDMFRSQAEALPFEMRVFISRDEAVEWLKT